MLSITITSGIRIRRCSVWLKRSLICTKKIRMRANMDSLPNDDDYLRKQARRTRTCSPRHCLISRQVAVQSVRIFLFIPLQRDPTTGRGIRHCSRHSRFTLVSTWPRARLVGVFAREADLVCIFRLPDMPGSMELDHHKKFIFQCCPISSHKTGVRIRGNF